MSFRLNPGLGRTDSETASNVLGGPSAKFGIPPHQIVAAYRAAQAAGARRFGCVYDMDAQNREWGGGGGLQCKLSGVLVRTAQCALACRMHMMTGSCVSKVDYWVRWMWFEASW
jgi:hypothetical protein